MAARVPFDSLELEERLFLDIQSVDGPLTESQRGMLEQLADVDSRGFHGRTLLYVAVRAGRKDWTEALLTRGADPCIRDADGEDAVRVAEAMAKRHPGVTAREDILMMVRMVQARDVARSFHGKSEVTAGVSAGSGNGSDTDVMASERPLMPKMDSHLKGFSERNNVLDERLTSLTDELESTKVECRNINDMVTQIINVQLPMLERTMMSFTQEINKTNDELRSTDTKVIDLATVIRETNTKIGILQSHLCDMHPRLVVDPMMRVTFIMDQNEEKMQRMLHHYGRLQEGQLTSSLIRFFASGRRVEVHVDFESEYIGRMKETLKDADGDEWRGSKFRVHADMEESRVYLGWKVDDNGKSSLLARGLARMAIHLAFNNGGRPYTEGDTDNRTRFQNILEEAMKKDRGGMNCILTYALDMKTPLGREIRLASAVPGIIAHYGSDEGTSLLLRQLPSLLTFYQEHVLPVLRTGDARV